MICKSHVRKFLQINRLQNALYGRLSRRRHSCAGGRRGFRTKSDTGRIQFHSQPVDLNQPKPRPGTPKDALEKEAPQARMRRAIGSQDRPSPDSLRLDRSIQEICWLYAFAGAILLRNLGAVHGSERGEGSRKPVRTAGTTRMRHSNRSRCCDQGPPVQAGDRFAVFGVDPVGLSAVIPIIR